jgi:acyl-CoA synthetase (AMP-forming)/AMP-acid ligase II
MRCSTTPRPSPEHSSSWRAAFPDHEALIFLDRTRREQRVSIGHLWTRARDIQNALTATELVPGGVVLLALPTGLELTAAYFGVILAGGVPAIVATPFHRFADRHVYVRHVGPILQLAQADAIYCTADVAEILRASPALSIDPASILTPRRRRRRAPARRASPARARTISPRFSTPPVRPAFRRACCSATDRSSTTCGRRAPASSRRRATSVSIGRRCITTWD